MDIGRNKDLEFSVLVEAERFLCAGDSAHRHRQTGKGQRHGQNQCQKLADLFHFHCLPFFFLCSIASVGRECIFVDQPAEIKHLGFKIG